MGPRTVLRVITCRLNCKQNTHARTQAGTHTHTRRSFLPSLRHFLSSLIPPPSSSPSTSITAARSRTFTSNIHTHCDSFPSHSFFLFFWLPRSDGEGGPKVKSSPKVGRGSGGGSGGGGAVHLLPTFCFPGKAEKVFEQISSFVWLL